MENIPSEENRSAENIQISSASKARSVNPYILPGSILIAALIVGGSIIYMVKSDGGTGTGASPKPVVVENPIVPSTAKLLGNDAVQGSDDAPVLVVEYGDYQCPFCGVFFKDVEPIIIQKYVETGKARFSFRHLAFLGPESVAAAESVECAKEQGKFWEYHSALYVEEMADGKEHNGNLNRATFMRLGQKAGVNASTFGSCIDSKKYADAVQQANAEAAAAGVYSTPTTFVNGRKVVVLDVDGNPVADTRGATQSVGANGQPIIAAIEAALKGR